MNVRGVKSVESVDFDYPVMELALSLGSASKQFSSFLDKSGAKISPKDLGFCMALKIKGDHEDDDHQQDHDLPVQLDLLPFSPVPRTIHHHPSQLCLPWLTENGK